MPTPQYGDVIFAKRLFYHHYGIYVSDKPDGKVIHYDKSSKNIIEGIKDTITFNGVIRETSYEHFHQDDPVYICRFNELVIEKLLHYYYFDISSFDTIMKLLSKILPTPINLFYWLYRIFNKSSNNTFREEHRAAIQLFSPEETVERAYQCIDEKGYNLLDNNCEHFAIWCKTGEKDCIQIEKILEEFAILSSL